MNEHTITAAPRDASRSLRWWIATHTEQQIEHPSHR
jgi:hypothetical protein